MYKKAEGIIDQWSDRLWPLRDRRGTGRTCRKAVN